MKKKSQCLNFTTQSVLAYGTPIWAYIIMTIVCGLILSCFISTKAHAEEKQEITGYWQFVNAIQDVPSCGRVLLSHTSDASHVFEGSVSFQEEKTLAQSLEAENLQYHNANAQSFMLIQNGQLFYIQLADGSYLKRSGDLTSPVLEQTAQIDEATLFRIEIKNQKTEGYVGFQIYEPYQLSNLYLYVNGDSLSLHHTNVSEFYILAETTKTKEPIFGKFTGLVRLFVIVAVLVAVYFLASLFRKKKLSFINFGIAMIALAILLFLFLLLVSKKEKPGLYVLHQSTYETQPIKSEDNRSPKESSYQILEDGSINFVFNIEEDSPFVWGTTGYDTSIFTVSSSRSETDAAYQMQVKGYTEGVYDMEFYYYDATKDFSSAIQAITYSITVDDNQKITSVEIKNGSI